MLKAFEWFHRQLGRVTVGVLFVALVFLALAFASALAGVVQPVPWFREAALAVGCAFAVLFAFFLATSVVAALVRYLGRPAVPTA